MATVDPGDLADDELGAVELAHVRIALIHPDRRSFHADAFRVNDGQRSFLVTFREVDDFFDGLALLMRQEGRSA